MSTKVYYFTDEATLTRRKATLKDLSEKVHAAVLKWEQILKSGASNTTKSETVEEIPESDYVRFLYGTPEQKGALFVNAEERSIRLRQILEMATEVAAWLRKWRVEVEIKKQQRNLGDIENRLLIMENFANREDLDRTDVEAEEAEARLLIADQHPLIIANSPKRRSRVMRSDSISTQEAEDASRVYTEEYKDRIMDSRKDPNAILAAKSAYPFIGFTLHHHTLLTGSILVVDELYVGGPAHQVGIRTGDVVARVGGDDTRTLHEMDAAVAKYCRTAQFVTFTLTDTGNHRNFDVNLWIMTTAANCSGYPFFFDTSAHGKVTINKRGRGNSRQLTPQGSRSNSSAASPSRSVSAGHAYQQRNSSPSLGNATSSNVPSPYRSHVPHYMMPARPTMTATERALIQANTGFGFTQQKKAPVQPPTPTTSTGKLPPLMTTRPAGQLPGQRRFARKK